MEVLAGMTSGMVGADLANLVNEAALLAVRRNKKTVGMPEFEEAVERVVAGLEKKNRLINAKEREILDKGAKILLEKEKIEGEELKALMNVSSTEPTEI